jgi:hypothetical protein
VRRFPFIFVPTSCGQMLNVWGGNQTGGCDMTGSSSGDEPWVAGGSGLGVKLGGEAGGGGVGMSVADSGTTVLADGGVSGTPGPVVG